MARLDRLALPDPEYSDFPFASPLAVPDPPAWSMGQVLDGLSARARRLDAVARLLENQGAIEFTHLSEVGDVLTRDTMALQVLVKRLVQLIDDTAEVTR